MSEIIPHTNTLIADFGTKFTRIGYAGDFHPYFVVETPELSEKSKIEFVCKTLEKQLKKTSTDSLILIQSHLFDQEAALSVLKYLFINKICQSIYFLKSPVADIFGFGKISGTVVSCSASSTSVSTVINGRIVETESIPPIQSGYSVQDLENPLTESMIKSINPGLEWIVEKVATSRVKNSINKKNTANGCVILTGGVFRCQSFFEHFRQLILARIGEDFSDFILRDKELNSTFTGASVFGMNNQTKLIFISIYDWQSHGPDCFKMKII